MRFAVCRTATAECVFGTASGVAACAAVVPEAALTRRFVSLTTGGDTSTRCRPGKALERPSDATGGPSRLRSCAVPALCVATCAMIDMPPADPAVSTDSSPRALLSLLSPLVTREGCGAGGDATSVLGAGASTDAGGTAAGPGGTGAGAAGAGAGAVAGVG